MPRLKTDPHNWPSLNKWLYSIGLSDELIRANTFYSALVDYFPGSIDGSHVVPSKDDIENERPRLVKTIVDFGPEIVVPIGSLSIAYCLNARAMNARARPLHDLVGKIYYVDPYMALGRKLSVIPLPHPSGSSTWKYKEENKVILDSTLKLLKSVLLY